MGDKNIIDYNLKDLHNFIDTEKEVGQRLKNSPRLARLYLWCVLKKKGITVAEASKFLRISRNHTNIYLNDLADINLLWKRKVGKNRVVFALNRDGEHYKGYIKIAKEVIGIKK